MNGGCDYDLLGGRQELVRSRGEMEGVEAQDQLQVVASN